MATNRIGKVATLAHSAERDTAELEFRTVLGTVWIALKGWAAPEVWATLYPTLTLAKSLDRKDNLLPTLYGLGTYVLCVGRVAEALHWADEMLELAKASGDLDQLISGHMMACNYQY